MDYTIIYKDSFEIIGKAMRISSKDENPSLRIAQFWIESSKTANFTILSELAGDQGMLGVIESGKDSDELIYMIAIQKPLSVVTEGFVQRQIPKSTWAVFEAIGPASEAISKLWKKIYSEWLPTSGYDHTNAPGLEVYPPGDPSATNYRSEVWVPIEAQ